METKESVHLGWLVAAAATRETVTKMQVRVRPFTVGTFHREDAERYAEEQMALDSPPAEGWTITVSAMPITRPS